MMMAVAAAVTLLDAGLEGARTAVAGLLLYAAIYLLMNTGAFAVVAVLRGAMRSEELKDYAGLIRTCPTITVAMVVVLVSLLGIPPLAGFIAKFAVFRALVDAGGPLMMSLLVIAGLNTAVSLVYYLRVAKIMCVDEEPDTRGAVQVGLLQTGFVIVVSLPILLLGVLPEQVTDWTLRAASQLLG